MDMRPLGRTGLKVSCLGLGTTKFGRTEGVKYPAAYDRPDDGRIRELFEIAAGAGMNLIDTAPAYGDAEARIGALLPDPDRWVVVTKAGEEFADGESRYDFSPQAIRASVERSRARLNRDVLDVVLLHSNGDDAHVLGPSGAIEALAELKIAGKIRAYGASVKTLTGGLLAAAICDVVMVSLSPGFRSLVPVVEAAATGGKGVLIKKPLDSGYERDPSVALAALASEPGVSSIVTGTIDPDHLRANCAAMNTGGGQPVRAVG